MTVRTCYSEHPFTLDPKVVAALWSVTTEEPAGPAAPASYRVLPDGCLDIVLRVHANERSGFAEPDLVVGGPARVASFVDVEAGAVILGVRYQPGRGGAALGVAASSITDLILSGPDARQALGPRAEVLRGAQSARELRARLVRLLAAQVDNARQQQPPAHASEAIAILRSRRGRVAVREIAQHVGVSERTLHRSVTEAAGLSPKTLAGVLRFQHALTLVRCGLPLADAALDSGYSDPAHMTRAFRALGGLTPGAGFA